MVGSSRELAARMSVKVSADDVVSVSALHTIDLVLGDEWPR